MQKLPICFLAAFSRNSNLLLRYLVAKLQEITNLILGILAATVALPFIILLMFISMFLTQKQWEDFCDELFYPPEDRQN